MTFKCRFTVPRESAWQAVEGATPEEAANEFHYRRDLDGIVLYLSDAGEPWRPGDSVSLALVEVEGHEPWMSRIFRSGLVRRGGIKLRDRTFDQKLAGVAKQLGWTGDPRELIAPGWEGENESWTH
jgi:hypothetical protein